MMNAEITYGAEPLRKVICKACDNSEFDQLVFLKKIAQSDNEDLTRLWTECVRDYSKVSPLTGDDAALLASFGEKLGASDSEHQSRLCEEYISLLHRRHDSARNRMNERIKLCKVCSVISGFVVLILLM